MKKLFVLSLVAVLSVGLLSVGAFAQPASNEDSDDTYVEWTIDAPMQCSLTVDAHAGLDLGTLDEVGTTFSDTGLVETSSNCEYVVQVTPVDVTAPISPSNVLDRFGIAVASSSNANTVNINNPWNPGSIGTTGTVGTAGNSNYGQEPDTDWTMSYSYLTTYEDQNDYYRVDLQYTASTT